MTFGRILVQQLLQSLGMVGVPVFFYNKIYNIVITVHDPRVTHTGKMTTDLHVQYNNNNSWI